MYKLRPYQQEAVDLTRDYFLSKSQKKHVLLVEPTGCHAKGTFVIKADGTLISVENVKVGDILLSPNGEMQRVLKLHSGFDMMYQITPVRGNPFIVNHGHILSLKCTKERNDPKRICASTKSGGEIENISVQDYINKSKHWKHLRKLYHCNAVEFPIVKDKLIIPPYILGLILGDGCTTNGCVSVTTMDDEIRDEVLSFASEWGLAYRISPKRNNKAYSIYLKRDGSRNRCLQSRIVIALRRLGLVGSKSGSKFIPYNYKTSSINDRKEILAGLIDTDGSLSRGGFDFISKSKQLSKDVAFIARSLGLSVIEKESIKSCQTGISGLFYRLYITGNTEIIPCRLKRKQAMPRKQIKNALVTGFSVNPLYWGDYYGFTLSGDHLYMTDNFMVHHNCGKSLIISNVAQDLDAPLLVFQPTKEILQQNYDKLVSYNTMGVTIYSASMRQKEIGNITLATIGSVYRKPELFRQFKYIMVDEADLCNAKGGVYKSFMEAVGEKHCGLTATPYRMSHDGYGGTMMKFLTRTNPRIFSRVLHVTQTRDLLNQGYLAKTEYFPINGFVRSEIKLNSTGADYNEPSEREYYDKSSFDKRIIKVVKRLLEIGKTRILVFTKFVHEAETLAQELGNVASVVHGEMNPKERDVVIKGFRAGKIKVVTNCAVLTAGFDYPELEVVVVARPTRSLRLWYQMTGRVVRPDLSDTTKTKMVVDMCGNYEIFGGIADMEIVERGGDNLWAVMSRGKQLTNKYLDEITRD